MKKIVERFIKIARPDFNFNEILNSGDVLSIFRFLILRSIRGSYQGLFFNKNKGATLIGKNVRLRNNRYIKSEGNLIIEDYAEVQGMSSEGINFGKNVSIGQFALIRPSDYYGRNIGRGLTIGDNSNIGPYNYIGCSGKITIGENVMFGPRVSLYAENHNYERLDISMKEQGVTIGEIIIEDDCWIASNSVIVNNVRIGKGSIVASGSIVTKDVPPHSVVAGVPAKIIKSRKIAVS